MIKKLLVHPTKKDIQGRNHNNSSNHHQHRQISILFRRHHIFDLLTTPNNPNATTAPSHLTPRHNRMAPHRLNRDTIHEQILPLMQPGTMLCLPALHSSISTTNRTIPPPTPNYLLQSLLLLPQQIRSPQYRPARKILRVNLHDQRLLAPLGRHPARHALRVVFVVVRADKGRGDVCREVDVREAKARELAGGREDGGVVLRFEA